jgi:hypothetical protein
LHKEDKDYGLETLLELNGEIFPMENGYWTKFEARKVEPSDHIPHGIKYSLTLHNRRNERILGYDNAHAIKRQGNKYIANRIVWDHKHKRDVVEAYEFDSAGQLLEDFWADVERILKEEKR